MASDTRKISPWPLATVFSRRQKNKLLMASLIDSFVEMSNLVEDCWDKLLHGFISQLSNSCQTRILSSLVNFAGPDWTVDQLRSQIRNSTAGVHWKHLHFLSGVLSQPYLNAFTEHYAFLFLFFFTKAHFLCLEQTLSYNIYILQNRTCLMACSNLP